METLLIPTGGCPSGGRWFSGLPPLGRSLPPLRDGKATCGTSAQRLQSGRRRLSQGHRAGRSTAGGRGASTVSGSTKASMHVRPHIRHEASNPARPRVQKVSHSKQPDQSSLFPHRPSDPSPHYYFISGFCCLVLLMCFILQLPAPLQSLN